MSLIMPCWSYLYVQCAAVIPRMLADMCVVYVCGACARRPPMLQESAAITAQTLRCWACRSTCDSPELQAGNNERVCCL
jgi:hypothetical protein